MANGKSDRQRTDARVVRSRHTVLTTTVELLYEAGVGGFSVDEVARRSGVAKTTIYRHWPTREALVLDACAQLTPEQPVPDTGSLTGDVTEVLAVIAAGLTGANWASVVPSIVDLAERDPDFADVHRRIQRGHAAALRTVLARADERGDLQPTTDIDTLVATLIGALFYRRWFSRDPVDATFVDALVRSTLGEGVDG